jgi:hypothetical protein
MEIIAGMPAPAAYGHRCILVRDESEEIHNATRLGAVRPHSHGGDGPRSLQGAKTAKVGGLGGFDYIYADDVGRKLYIRGAVRGKSVPARVVIYDLDTLAPAGEPLPKAKTRDDRNPATVSPAVNR